MRIILFLAAALAFVAPMQSCAKSGPSKQTLRVIDETLDFAVEQSQMMYHTYLESDRNLHPRTVKSDGEFEAVGVGWWTSGFYPGVMWYLYEYSDDEAVRDIAEEMSERVLVRQFATNHHDVGFQVNCSSGNGYRLTGEQRYQEALENGAKSLATRFSPIVGCTRSWSGKPWNYPVIIDNMMNLELLCVGAVLSEDRETLDMAISHADRSMKELYRADYSCFHVADFNPETGDLIKAVTHQGYADSSAWARGQAWGLYGYTMLYRFTNDKRYLDQAQNVAHFLIDHPNMPEDMVPYWDFDAPNIPEASRDASAAAIMASALVELSTFVDSASSKKFYDVAEKQVLSLSKAPYRSAKVGDNCGFILTNSVGFMAKNSEVDTPLTYADYYFVEAMMRIKKLATGERIGESYSCDCE